ncbi:hypothetical protein D3C75_619440 [compost metagenome]
MAAMPVIVHGIVIVTDEIPAPDIVHITVPVIVDAIAGNLARIGPQVCSNIGMCVIDSRINNRNRYSIPPCCIPRLRRR